MDSKIAQASYENMRGAKLTLRVLAILVAIPCLAITVTLMVEKEFRVYPLCVVRTKWSSNDLANAKLIINRQHGHYYGILSYSD